MPTRRGIPRREFLMATSCKALIFSMPLMLNTPPMLPCAMSLPTFVLSAPPVVMSPATIRLSCPIFSCSVIFAMSWSTNSFMGSILTFLVVVVSFFFGAELLAIAGAPIEPTNRNISDKSVVFIVYIVKCNKSLSIKI